MSLGSPDLLPLKVLWAFVHLLLQVRCGWKLLGESESVHRTAEAQEDKETRPSPGPVTAAGTRDQDRNYWLLTQPLLLSLHTWGWHSRDPSLSVPHTV